MGTVDKNIEIAFDFARAIVDDPTIVDEVPEGATVILIPEDDTELAERNREIGFNSVEQGKDVYFRHVKTAASTP